MADRPMTTTEGAIEQAEVSAVGIADPGATPSPIVGKIRLFKNSLGVPTVNTLKADFEAEEADFTGYPAGGYDITDMLPVMPAPGGGVVITSNKVNVSYTSGDPNTIGGYWVEDGAGNVFDSFIYDPVRTLAALPDGWPIVYQFGQGRNAS